VSGSPVSLTVEIHSWGTIQLRIDTPSGVRFRPNGMALLKKHGGGIFTSIRVGRKEAKGPSPKTLGMDLFRSNAKYLIMVPQCCQT
jgi:hypothetical protein